MQRLGQHFLKNKSVLQSIAAALNLAPDDVIIEIGPGHGELTDFLRGENPATRIILIEKDKKLFDLLNEKFGNDARVTIMLGDALIILPEITNEPKSKKSKYKIVGNIPYYITGHLFRVLSELTRKPELGIFMIQEEVAERICAAPPRMNRLAASVQYWAEPHILQVIPSTDFSPKPKVASAVISFKTKRSFIDVPNYYIAIRTLFSQPRKTIINNLKSGAKQKGGIFTEKLSAIGIIPSHRPQDLSVSDIISIAKTFFTSSS
jgi:16S rRNA (adenine1518-N6/adenine1519-N6)-dimethyltransferase